MRRGVGLGGISRMSARSPKCFARLRLLGAETLEVRNALT